MSDTVERVIDFDKPTERARVAAGVQKLRGRWRLMFVRFRPRRSDRQNRYYWPCFVDPYARLLTEYAGETILPDEAHDDLKRRFLLRRVANRETGEVIIETARSTTKLTTVEFNHYLDQCAAFLASIGIVVPEPSEYHERDDKEAA